MANKIVFNETPSRLILSNIRGEELTLAPLQERKIDEESAYFFNKLERDGIVSTRDDTSDGIGAKVLEWLIVGGVWLLIGAVVLTSIDPRFGLDKQNWAYVVWGVGVLILVVSISALFIHGTNSFTAASRWTRQKMVLLFILSIGVGLPTATIYFFGGGEQMRVASPFLFSLALYGRLIELAFLVTASLLPTLLFFLFDRHQLATLRKRLYINLFRLNNFDDKKKDPCSVMTISGLNGKYGEHIREAYGSETKSRGRLSPGSRMPVLVCAFVITIGWIVTLSPVGEYNPQNIGDVMKELLPQNTATVFAFLGAYFYTLQLIALQYARGELKPKAYTHIMVRIFLAVVLSWMLEAIFSGDTTEGASTTMLVLAFLCGYMPDNFFTWLKEIYRKRLPENIIPPQVLPLNELEGIDIYDLGRLESEGIVNIEGLAHHELMDLIIETRIPVPRLIDWVDQAILYLHLTGGSDETARETLRNYGIRTATDLMRTWDEAKARGDVEFKAFKKLLGEDKPYRLEVIRDSLLDDEWMQAVSRWRNEEPHPSVHFNALPETVEEYENFAEQELNANRYPMALNMLLQSLQVQDTARVRRKIAHILATSPVVEIRNREEARLHAKEAFGLAPESYDGTVDLIGVYIELEDTENARIMCERANHMINSWPSSKLKDAKEIERQKNRIKTCLEEINALDKKLRAVENTKLVMEELET